MQVESAAARNITQFQVDSKIHSKLDKAKKNSSEMGEEEVCKLVYVKIFKRSIASLTNSLVININHKVMYSTGQKYPFTPLKTTFSPKTPLVSIVRQFHLHHSKERKKLRRVTYFSLECRAETRRARPKTFSENLPLFDLFPHTL